MTPLQRDPDQVDGPKTTRLDQFISGFVLGIGFTLGTWLVVEILLFVARIWVDQL